MLQFFKIRENRLVLLIISGTLLLTSLPYLVGYFLHSNMIFFGGNHLNSADTLVYLSYIEQVKHGAILVSNLFTAEPQRGIYFTPLWLCLGLIARFTKLSSFFVFHLARILAGFLFLYFIYYHFLNLFLKTYREKIIALLLICFSSGLGLFFSPSIQQIVYANNFNSFPVDLTMPEANTFLSLAHSGLFVISQLLILLIFYLSLKENTPRINYLYIFLFSLFLGFTHPYDLIIVLGVLGVYFLVNFIFYKLKLINDKKIFIYKYLAVIFGFMPFLIYYFAVLRNELAIWGWMQQNITLSPPLKNYLFGFGLLIVFGLYSLYLKKWRENKLVYFLIIWSGTLFCLAYLPLAFQRRLIMTEHIALAILASYGISAIVNELFNIYKNKIVPIIFTAIFLIFFWLSSWSFLYTAIYYYKALPQYFYFSERYHSAATWLRENSLTGEAIIASDLNSRYIATISARPVFVGHGYQTIDYTKKRNVLDNWFFKNQFPANDKRAFLLNNNIKYIFYSGQEKKLGNFDPNKAEFLEAIYANDEATIYKVK